MHGIILTELKKYVVARLGPPAWPTLMADAKLTNRVYLPNQVYPDAEVEAIVAAASRSTGRPAGALLEDFGEFIAPDLLTMYAAQINPAWRTLEVIEHTEETIHRLVRLRDPTAKPPMLACHREGSSTVVIHYTSPRRLCAVAKGIARGVAARYGQKVEIDERVCMHRGGDACDIAVTLTDT